MNIEYALHDTSINDLEFKAHLSHIVKYNINIVSVLYPQLRLAQNILSDKNILLATPIDYPFGICSTEIRCSMIEYASRFGCKIVDIMIPHHAIANRKYDKFRNDIKNNLEICNKLNLKTRYTFEYRVFNYETLYKLAEILISFGINEIILSSGYRLDNIYDNIIAGSMITKKVPKIKIINNGDLWNSKQIDHIMNINPYGIRIYHLPTLDLLVKN